MGLDNLFFFFALSFLRSDGGVECRLEEAEWSQTPTPLLASTLCQGSVVSVYGKGSFDIMNRNDWSSHENAQLFYSLKKFLIILDNLF